MSMDSWMEREESQLSEDFQTGKITLSEYNKAMRDLQRDYREAAREAADLAYDNELERW